MNHTQISSQDIEDISARKDISTFETLEPKTNNPLMTFERDLGSARKRAIERN
jgi:hypothetical protein